MLDAAPRGHPMADTPLLIGWKEYADLPDLGVRRVKVKVDSGARTSTLHIRACRILEVLPDGTEQVELTLNPWRRSPERTVTVEARVLRYIQVTDSGGHRELRPVIETELALGPVRKRILVTLTDRSGMLFRMILGRKALEGDFHIDVSRKYLLRRKPTST
jgi:hypothetical protein